MVQAIANLRNAIQVLSKHQTTQAFLQLDGPVRSGMRVLLRDIALKYQVASCLRIRSFPRVCVPHRLPRTSMTVNRSG